MSTTVYDIRDVAGRLVARHVREDKPDGSKLVRWQRPEGEWGLNGTPVPELPLYGSERLSGWDENTRITICEGEKATQALLDAGLPALGTTTGASSTPGCDPLDVLRGREVTLWPDNDPAGLEHMGRVAERLQGVAACVRWYEWLEAANKGDAADHPAVVRGDARGLDRLLNELMCAPEWRPAGRNARSSVEEILPVEVGRLLSEVVTEAVRWLWTGRVPLGKLTVLDGDPGNGKSAVTVDISARVTVGRPWPDGTPCETGGVVLLNAEDGLADTIRPRLEAAGADLDQVLALATTPTGEGPERLLSIPEDLDIIRKGIHRVEARLVVVDPLMAFVSGHVNSHKDQDVRRALAPLAMLAEETGAAVVVVRHLNQATGQNALYRGGGSIGIIGQARSGMLVAKDPQDEDRRILAPLKSNLAAPAPSLAFVLSEAANGAVRVEWKGETHYLADALLASPVDPEERSALEEATEFLSDALKAGPMWSKAVKKEAREADIAEITLKRAKAALGIRSVKEADGSWSWTLPEADQSDQPERSDPKATQDDPVDPLDPLPIDKLNPGDRGEKLGNHGDPFKKRNELTIDKPNSRGGEGQSTQGDHASGRDDAEALGAFLADPPEWFLNKARVCLEEGSPNRLVNPLANHVSTHLHGTPWRWREVLPHVRRSLEEV